MNAMSDARLLLQDHEINQVRVDLGENPANMVWLWGQGTQAKMEGFKKRYGLSGSVVSAMEFTKGIARAVGLTAVDVQGATGDLETDYERKGKVLLQEIS